MLKDIFVDLLLEGHTPEELAEVMTEALHEVEEVKTQLAREAALEECAVAMNRYFNLVDPDWQDLSEEDVEAIGEMIAAARSVTNAILDVFIDSIPEVEHECCCSKHAPDPAPAPTSSDEEDDIYKAICDFLSELGL